MAATEMTQSDFIASLDNEIKTINIELTAIALLIQQTTDQFNTINHQLSKLKDTQTSLQTTLENLQNVEQYINTLNGLPIDYNAIMNSP